MSDGMSHAADDHDRARTRAYARYGSLSEQEIVEVGESLSKQIEEARLKRDEAQRVLTDLERQMDDLWIVVADVRNGRRPKVP